MKTELALAEAQRRVVRDIVERIIPGAQLWVFGSRATGRARPYSDLDLLVTSPSRLTWMQRTA